MIISRISTGSLSEGRVVEVSGGSLLENILWILGRVRYQTRLVAVAAIAVKWSNER